MADKESHQPTGAGAGDEGDRDLNGHGVFRRAEEVLDLEGLLDPAQEQLFIALIDWAVSLLNWVFASLTGFTMRRKFLKAIAALFAGLIVLLMLAKLVCIPIYKSAYYWLYDYSQPIDYGYTDTSGDYFGYVDTRGDSYFGNLTRRQPPDVQKVVKPLIAELRAKSYDDLIILKAEPNPCELSDLLDCHNIDPKTVKQYIEAAFAYRQFMETTEISRHYNYISFVSMIISLISLAAVITGQVVGFRNRLHKP